MKFQRVPKLQSFEFLVLGLGVTAGIGRLTDFDLNDGELTGFNWIHSEFWVLFLAVSSVGPRLLPGAPAHGSIVL